ncbi:MAG: hypothetical protein ACXAE3_10640 [Candidatus Kariarchaeaceae archaeon]|jgi:sugar/nucleoside kinase (ribokinase family)
MPSADQLNVLLVGHVSLDHREARLLPGGPPRYQIPILLAHQVQKIDVLTSVLNDKELRMDGVRIFNSPTLHDTVFSFSSNDRENEDDRTLVLDSRAADLDVTQLDASSQYDLIIISGIAEEVSLEMVSNLRSLYSQASIVVDAQTFARTVHVGKPAKVKTLDQPILDLLDDLGVVLRGSFVELEDLEHYSYKGLLIRTNRGEDIQVNLERKNRSYTFTKTTEITDSTGSGDIFLVSFMLEYLTTQNIESALEYAFEYTRQFLSIQGIPTVEEAEQVVKSMRGMD